MNRMKDLMIETLETLKNSKGKYNSALETFVNLKHQIESENQTLKKMLDKEIDNFEQAINVAIAVLEEEIEIIGKWTQSAKVVSDTTLRNIL